MSVYIFTCVGIKPFDKEYTYNNVTLYLLSALLKSRLVHSRDLAKVIECSPRQAQRIINDTFEKRTNTYNLNVLGSILNHIDYSFSDLFKSVDEFIKAEYYSATFIDNTMKGYHENEFNNHPYDIENLKRVMNTLNRSQRYALDDADRKALLKEITMYPTSLIKQTQDMV